MNRSLLYTTALYDLPADRAAERIAKALGLEVSELAGEMLDPLKWRRAPHAMRCHMLGEWLRAECFRDAERGQMTVEWSPIGGEKYANQND